MSVRVMSAVWLIDLPDSQKIVLLALADCANDEGHCWPSMATLAKKCSKGARTIQGVIKQLVDIGHLSRNEVIGKGCKYLVHPRSDCAPAAPAPRKDRAPPPQPLRETPAAAADKPSKNHKKPSTSSASDDAAPANDDEFSDQDVLDSWNETARDCGLAVAVKLTEARRAAIRARRREWPEIGHWKAAFRNLRESSFLLGGGREGWKADFNFFVQSKSFAKLVEGSYG